MSMKNKVVFTVAINLFAAVVACTSDKSGTGSSSGQKATDTSTNRVSNAAPDSVKSGTDSAWVLIPGVSAGSVKINEDASILNKQFGKPDGGDAAMGKAVSIWYSNHDTSDHSVAIYSSRNMGNDDIARIRQIRVTSPAFKTKEGAGPGMSLSEIRKHYTLNKTEDYTDKGTKYSVYDSKEGIAFECEGSGRCTAVIIHKPGKTEDGTYLKFRDTAK